MNDQKRPRRRPNRAAVEQLLNLNPNLTRRGHPELREDVDGDPLSVEMVDDGPCPITVLSLESLSWTQAEWDDPNVTE